MQLTGRPTKNCMWAPSLTLQLIIWPLMNEIGCAGWFSVYHVDLYITGKYPVGISSVLPPILIHDLSHCVPQSTQVNCRLVPWTKLRLLSFVFLPFVIIFLSQSMLYSIYLIETASLKNVKTNHWNRNCKDASVYLTNVNTGTGCDVERQTTSHRQKCAFLPADRRNLWFGVQVRDSPLL
jgi:hypothetical protein